MDELYAFDGVRGMFLSLGVGAQVVDFRYVQGLEGGDAGGGEGGEGGGAVEDRVGGVGEVEGAEVVDGGDGNEGRGGEGGHCWLWVGCGSGWLHFGGGGCGEEPLAFCATTLPFTYARFSTFPYELVRVSGIVDPDLQSCLYYTPR